MSALKVCFLFMFVLVVSACSMDASIQGMSEQLSQSRTTPDFVDAEFVTTTMGSPGYQVRAAFGEISEETTSTNGNGWKVQGVFYQ